MSEQDLEVFDDGDILHESPRKRPVFILVLAILSWLWVAIGVLGGIINSLSSLEKQEEAIDTAIAIYEDADEMPMRDDLIAFMVASKENIKLNNLGQLIILLIEGIAVYMMFMLKKSGFWLYTLAQVAFLGMLIYIFPYPNFVTTLTVMLYAIIILIFEILYAVNLKHMQ